MQFIYVYDIKKKKKDDLSSDTSALEKRIDILVYRLYGLIYDEVLIVDPDTPITEAEYNNEGERNE